MNRCFGAILSPLNHQYCRSTTYRFLVSSLFLVQELVALVVVQELVFLLLAVAVESSGYILLLIYEHSLLQLVDHLFFLVLVVQLASLVLVRELVEEPALVLVVQLVLLGLEFLELELVFLAH
ncbi:Uncharacterised protein [Streptococcus pneumoniae]|nr:Uncharacterised protein [Streptococcus pneumoniae]VLX47267.1 Uncharacterised protein [Streptococcus pneumoniae]VMG96359.1 Uncharacterised protein [Streptococcus pneumoniae]VMJ58150.1 Uncharacterised protein [Streptococcus pneumoniae]VMO81311.1 Uncharacterised protein [Streptococcus pneumoniae]